MKSWRHHNTISSGIQCGPCVQELSSSINFSRDVEDLQEADQAHLCTLISHADTVLSLKELAIFLVLCKPQAQLHVTIAPDKVHGCRS